jgi:hypothetical protein
MAPISNGGLPQPWIEGYKLAHDEYLPVAYLKAFNSPHKAVSYIPHDYRGSYKKPKGDPSMRFRCHGLVVKLFVQSKQQLGVGFNPRVT